MRENYALHKLHSLTGVIPTGFYLVQHLTLNSFSLAGEAKFNGVIGFFDSIPKHALLALELLIWACLFFHAIYGVMIISRAQPNLAESAYKYRENKYYTWQRASGMYAFLFLVVHMASTTGMAKFRGAEVLMYSTWHDRLAFPNGLYLGLVFYALGIVACSYHFAYGLWNFAIRWGITVGEKSQHAMARVAQAVFIGVSVIGCGALLGFFYPIFGQPAKVQSAQAYPSGYVRPANLNR